MITKIVNINADLEPVPPTKGFRSVVNPNIENYWKYDKCKHRFQSDRTCTCEFLYSTANCESNTRCHSNSFYGAFVEAYNTHKDIVLSPDDVWMVINLQFSKYINDNAEKMRDMLVNHSGKKTLQVKTWNELEESQWDEFFTLMSDEIAKNTKDGIFELLKADFTSTTTVERIISTATIMNSFKKYFNYGRCIPSCGIKNVQFMGTLEDWTKLRIKVLELKKYAVDDAWLYYINELMPILAEFINTYNENVNVDFWNKVMNIEHGRLGSGSTTKVSGWILKFFNIHTKVDSSDIKNYTIDVPILIDNRMTLVKKNVSLLGGFSGVNETDGAFRPQMSLVIYYDSSL